ncbi:MAG: hypothetical protein ACYC4H_08450, partial [Desulfocucumaceae bacterium]
MSIRGGKGSGFQICNSLYSLRLNKKQKPPLLAVSYFIWFGVGWWCLPTSEKWTTEAFPGTGGDSGFDYKSSISWLTERPACSRIFFKAATSFFPVVLGTLVMKRLPVLRQ